MNNKVLAIIPARGGSKGIPRKNIRPFLGKPLIEYSIKLALSCKEIDKVIVTTDDEEIAEISKNAGAEVPFIRPENLAQDDTPTLPALRHAINFLEEKEEIYDNIILLEPTAPLRTKELIQKTIKKIKEDNVETVVSTVPYNIDFSDILKKDESDYLHPFLDVETTIRRQDTKNIHLMDASIYAVKRDILMDENLIMLNPYKENPNLKTKTVLSNPKLSCEIDDEEQWEYAEYLYKKYKNIIEKGEEEND
ncbi:acylneuraminate cytidylyltransferase family protein [Candidatus Woesearchaeota archaeon]|jgi:CMP-N,N'-diacetyllegionaminic acid synthase|nr:acylneuraminate cytidylyltransferase family protein [Candidatus Woesearchaeota archaeon]